MNQVMGKVKVIIATLLLGGVMLVSCSLGMFPHSGYDLFFVNSMTEVVGMLLGYVVLSLIVVIVILQCGKSVRRYVVGGYFYLLYLLFYILLHSHLVDINDYEVEFLQKPQCHSLGMMVRYYGLIGTILLSAAVIFPPLGILIYRMRGLK